MQSQISLFRHTTNGTRFAADQQIFAEGEPGNQMYIVLAGEVELLRNGRQIALAGPGDVIGEMALIDGGPRSASAIARKASTLLAIDEKRFAFMVQETPYFAIQMLRVLSERLRSAA